MQPSSVVECGDIIRPRALRSNRGRNSALSASTCRSKLSLADAVDRFNAGDRDCCIPKPLQAEHHGEALFHIPMVLLDQVVQVFRRTQLRVGGQRPIGLEFAHRAVRGGIAIQRDRSRGAPLALYRFAEERLGSGDIASGAQPEIDRVSGSINHSGEITPLASNFDVCLVNSPRRPHGRTEPFPTFLELGCLVLHPPHDGRVGQGQATLSHYLYEVPQAQFKPEIPAYSQDDDVAIKMTAGKQFLHPLQLGHPTCSAVVRPPKWPIG